MKGPFNLVRQARVFHIAETIRLIRENEGITRTQLAQELFLSKAAVSGIVRQLMNVGIVQEAGQEVTSKIGRNRIRLCFKEDRYDIAAIDCGGSNLRAAITDLYGQIRFSRSEPPKADGSIDEQLRSLVDLLLENTKKERLLGLGIGVAGTIDSYTKTVLASPALGKKDWMIAQELEDEYGIPVLIDNDVNLAALGESWRGTARGEENVICVSVGTGIGAGLIIDGQLYRGSHNLAGEIGYLYNARTLPQASYNGFGAFELRASGYGILQQALKRLENGATSLVSEDLTKLSTKLIIKGSADGDPLARDLIENACTEIGISVANIISILDVDAVVLTGGLIRGLPEILPRVQRAISLICPPEMREKVKVRVGKLKDRCVLVGAARLVSDERLPLVVR